MSSSTSPAGGEPEELQKTYSAKLHLEPNCLEFSKLCPEYFAMGSYHLEQLEKLDDDTDMAGEPKAVTQKKIGVISLWKLTVQTSPLGRKSPKPVKVQQLSGFPAVYDLHFRGNILAATLTNGKIVLHEIIEEFQEGHDRISSARLRFIQEFQVCEDTSTMVIALAWYDKDVFAVSLSGGSVLLCRLKMEMGQENLKISHVHNHSDNAYCVAWGNTWGRKMNRHLYSGGDDSQLICTRICLDEQDNPDPGFNDPQAFKFTQMGLTSLLVLSHHTDEATTDFFDHILTGGYDNKVRMVWVCSPVGDDEDSESAIATCDVKATLDLGGTIHKLERVKEKKCAGPMQKTVVLASCASIGVRMLLVTWDQRETMDGVYTIELLAKFDHGGELNYASGMLQVPSMANEELKELIGGKDKKESMAIGLSTSFYDKSIKLWRYNLDSELHR